ncbi:hypothetical protein D3C87_720060 [compost metagenome]
MILAEVNEVNANLLMVRFSEPNESFENKKFIPVFGSISMVKTMVAYKNRIYIADTICSFLRQRAHAKSAYPTIITTLIHNIEKLKQGKLFELALYIANNQHRIELISPSETSRFYNHYKNIIEPILVFCKNSEEMEAMAEKNIQRTN